ncbi:MAG TPA: class I SAM-dependent methyltransferase [Acidimicrobiales bacterium]|nr:class I SAM-dependent methyltransferase [Acidimicrobiales bacterium]
MAVPGSDPNRFTRSLFDGLGRRYDGLAELLSFGQNGRWRTEAVGRVLAAESVTTPAPVSRPDSSPLVLDVASGTAGIALELNASGGGGVIGIDLTEAMLRRGAENVRRAGAQDAVQLLVGRAEQLPFPDGSFDGLTFSYLLRYVADPAASLKELARVVRPGGRVASLEFGVPPSLFWRFWWWLYTRLVLPAAGMVTGGPEWYRVGRFLGPNISGHYRRYSVDWTVAAWEAAGLVDVGFKRMSLGGGLIMWGRRAGG